MSKELDKTNSEKGMLHKGAFYEKKKTLFSICF